MVNLSVRQMAAALGVSKSQAGRDKDAGMPMHAVEAARAWRVAQHDLSRTVEGRIDRPQHSASAVDADAAGDASAPDAADIDTVEFRSARARRERINAERAQIELDKLRGALVELKLVAELRFTEFRALRDGLGHIGARIKDQLAIESDPMKCAQLVDDEVGEILGAFAAHVLTRGVAQDQDDDEQDEPPA